MKELALAGEFHELKADQLEAVEAEMDRNSRRLRKLLREMAAVRHIRVQENKRIIEDGHGNIPGSALPLDLLLGQ